VIATSDLRPSKEAIMEMIPRFVGEIMQVPPQFSAIKVDGERAYDLARQGEEVDLQSRPISIFEAELTQQPDEDHAVFEMVCGKGSYVRAWVRDLAEALGTHAHVTELRRLSSGPFTENGAISLDKLETFSHSPAALEHLLPISTALDDIPALAVLASDAVRLRSGNPILLRAAQFAQLVAYLGDDAETDLEGLTVFLSTVKGEPIALATATHGELRPFRVFNFGNKNDVADSRTQEGIDRTIRDQ